MILNESLGIGLVVASLISILLATNPGVQSILSDNVKSNIMYFAVNSIWIAPAGAFLYFSVNPYGRMAFPFPIPYLNMIPLMLLVPAITAIVIYSIQIFSGVS